MLKEYVEKRLISGEERKQVINRLIMRKKLLELITGEKRWLLSIICSVFAISISFCYNALIAMNLQDVFADLLNWKDISEKMVLRLVYFCVAVLIVVLVAAYCFYKEHKEKRNSEKIEKEEATYNIREVNEHGEKYKVLEIRQTEEIYGKKYVTLPINYIKDGEFKILGLGSVSGNGKELNTDEKNMIGCYILVLICCFISGVFMLDIMILLTIALAGLGTFLEWFVSKKLSKISDFKSIYLPVLIAMFIIGLS